MPTFSAPETPEVYGRMYRLIDEYNNSNGQRGLLNTTEARNAYLREAEMRNTDWFDVLFTNAVSQNHSVSITAGTEKSSFYASLSACSILVGTSRAR